ncbi:uncharacterized protein BDZ83DRAFT_343565 [Colletotrichum acutatum]|uniref:Uncharacterized protein n=1 Tax=Glomerella acutata TaxID=27357 RepID=A0AAD8XNY9_GLOAC|nr:uncharacterized protein BDZ83DRAFT_343565 [Colletotrichum acutatum]KAK1730875.1 hypothetical protein BDZ83DRAFT_343565 [Colletotrichum acutatum]
MATGEAGGKEAWKMTATQGRERRWRSDAGDGALRGASWEPLAFFETCNTGYVFVRTGLGGKDPLFGCRFVASGAGQQVAQSPVHHAQEGKAGTTESPWLCRYVSTPASQWKEAQVPKSQFPDPRVRAMRLPSLHLVTPQSLKASNQPQQDPNSKHGAIDGQPGNWKSTTIGRSGRSTAKLNRWLIELSHGGFGFDGRWFFALLLRSTDTRYTTKRERHCELFSPFSSGCFLFLFPFEQGFRVSSNRLASCSTNSWPAVKNPRYVHESSL